MTTNPRGRSTLRWLGVTSSVAAALILSCASSHETRRGDTVDVSGYPDDIREAYRVFAVRCGRCHGLARPLNARIHDPQHWVRYVTRMRRQPGSGINHENADVILRFLLFYTAELHDSGSNEDLDVPAEQEAPR